MTEETHHQEPTAAQQAVFDAWKSDNPWFDENTELAECADRISLRVLEESPDLTGRAFFDRVTEMVKEQHPDAFVDEPPGIPADESVAAPQDGVNGAGPVEPPEKRSPRKPRAERTRAISNVTPEAFRAWRKRLGLSQCEAARQLGISERQVGYFDHGEKPIPLTVAMAGECLEWRGKAKKVREAFCLLGQVFGVNVDEVSAECAENSKGNGRNAAT